MANKLQRFQIKLDKTNKTFAPGEAMTGNVIVGLSRTKSVQALTVRIKGTARVEWCETRRRRRHSKTDRYIGDEQYFKLEEILVGGSQGGENVNIEAGTHTYPFSFILPHSIPSTFECKGGSVKYSIKAVMDRASKSDHKTTMEFKVEAPYDLSEVPTARRNIVDEGQEFFCAFPAISTGPMKYHVYVAQSGFAVGESIEAKFKIDTSSSSVNVTKLKLKVEQIIKLFARTKMKKRHSVVQRTNEFRPFGKNIDTSLNLQVPAVPLSSLKHCGIIDIQYQLTFYIGVSGCRSGILRTYPIVIGTRPVPSLQPAPNEHSRPGSDQRLHSGPNESNAPSAPDISDSPSSPSEKTPLPMPMPEFKKPTCHPPYPLPRDNEAFGSPHSLGSANQPYPPSIPSGSSGFQYPMASNRPIGFIDVNTMEPSTSTELPEIPPPSYEDCLNMTKQK